MRKLLLSLASASALLGLMVMPAAASHGGEPTVIVMQHLCNPDIQSEADFQAVEDAGAGGQPGGEGTLPGLVATVLACPTVYLPGDIGTDGIAAEPMDFEYTLTDSAAADDSLTGDAMFRPAKLCESDIALDVDGDGDMDSTTCLDVSMYGFEPVAEGAVTVTQTAAPGDSRFGTLRFTPASTDELALMSAANGVVQLDTSADTQVDSPPLPLAEYNDDVVVVHVYNFQNAAAATPTPSSSAPAATSMPNTAIGTDSAPAGMAWLIGLSVALLTIGGGSLVLARRRQR